MKSLGDPKSGAPIVMPRAIDPAALPATRATARYTERSKPEKSSERRSPVAGGACYRQ